MPKGKVKLVTKEGFRLYGESKPVKIDLGVCGRSDLWVELVNIADEYWGVAYHYLSLGANMTGPDIEELLTRYIIRWNLPDPDTGVVMPIPKGDAGSIAKLPMKVVALLVSELVGAKAGSRISEDALVPPQNGSTS